MGCVGCQRSEIHPWSRSGQLNLLCGAGNVAKIWSAGGQREIKDTEMEQLISVREGKGKGRPVTSLGGPQGE